MYKIVAIALVIASTSPAIAVAEAPIMEAPTQTVVLPGTETNFACPWWVLNDPAWCDMV